MLLRLRRRRRAPYVPVANGGESGQALLELALVTPVLVLLVMAIFQFAYVIQSQVGLTNAVREAARRAAATSSPAPVWANLQTWTLLQLNGDGTPSNPGLLPTNVQGYSAGRLWPAPYPDLTPANTTSPAVQFCGYPAAGSTSYQVKVVVKYMHPLFFGPLGFATDLVDGTNNGFWDLTASAEIRMENVDDADPLFDDPPACV